ncbi:MAG TPA: FUSC family protein [Stackebrandtia sp.]|jgi:uncharacterized membrane protein YccC|uniref:FUSC family protein n=1 Tax=Stackebrandtia sp. TaxID=2023065 RepID=UPI002D3C497C|nr:FUSC family protein [Stackebrandtia sp.]HZE38588.1 FUSC family protein [Stackebrandtia sp.]
MAIVQPAKKVGSSLMAWNPNASTPGIAVRTGIGVAFALGLGAALGEPPWAPALVMGTWSSGIPLVAAGVRTRPWLPLVTGVALGASLALGGLTYGHPIAMVVVTAIWAFLMALLGSLGPAAAVVSTNCGVMMVLGPHFTGGANILVAAGVAALGGVIQAVTAAMPPRQRFRDERQTLAAAYRALADDAGALADAMNTPLSTDALLRARDELNGNRRLPEAMRDSVGALYELRASIVAVAAARARLLDSDPAAARHTASVLRNTAATLEVLAEAVDRLRPLREHWEDRLAAAVEAAPVDDTLHGTARHSAAGRESRRLYRAMHQIGRLTERVVEEEPPTTVVSRRVRMRGRLAEDWQTLRASLTLRSPAMRHAIRSCVVIAVATVVSAYWPGQHGYWLALTAWIVLKADFATTVGRGLARMLGTGVGVVLASLLSLVVFGESWWTVLLVVAFAFAGYFAMPVSYVIFSAAVAGFSVFQIDLAGQSALTAAAERGVATVVGGVLALTLYTLWPTWQTRRLPDLLADLVESYRDYADLVLDMQARPAERDMRRVRDTVDEIRLRRAQLNAAAEAAAAEPVGGPRPYSSDALDVEAALSRAARALIVLEGSVRRGDAAQLYGVDEFREEVHRAYSALADRVRGHQPRPVDLRVALDDLDGALESGTVATVQRRRLLDWESDILVEALSDADLIVREWARDA